MQELNEKMEGKMDGELNSETIELNSETIKGDPAASSTNTAARVGDIKKNFVLYGALLAIGIALVIFASIGIAGARRVSNHPLVLASAKIFGINAAVVNGDGINYGDYIRDMKALTTFYSSNAEVNAQYTPEEQSDQVLSRLIANKLIKQEAKKYNVSVTEKDMAEVIEKLTAKFDGDQKKLSDDIEKNFAMSMSTFFNSVVRPSILEQKLALAFSSSTLTEADADDRFKSEQIKARHILFQVKNQSEDKSVKAKAQKVLDRIKKGEEFATLAKQYGSDGTKSLGGDLGWFSKGQMVKEFESAAFALSAGELAPELVKTEFGYHIIKVDERKTSRDFAAFMSNQLDNTRIKIYGKIHNPFKSISNTADTASTTQS